GLRLAENPECPGGRFDPVGYQETLCLQRAGNHYNPTSGTSAPKGRLGSRPIDPPSRLTQANPSNTSAKTRATRPCLTCTWLEPSTNPGIKCGSEPAGTNQ